MKNAVEVIPAASPLPENADALAAEVYARVQSESNPVARLGLLKLYAQLRGYISSTGRKQAAAPPPLDLDAEIDLPE